MVSNDKAPEKSAVDCGDVVSYGGLALDGSLPIRAAFEVGKHLRICEDCTNYVDQVAKTRALLGLRAAATGASTTLTQRNQRASDGGEAGTSQPVLARTQAYLMSLARATDLAHADDLVQDTWDHYLGGSPGTVPDRETLAAYLIQLARDHVSEEQSDRQAWADDLVRHHPHNRADLAESDLPADPGGHEDWRTLADLDALDPDADRAELYLPDLYGDGPDQGGWTTPPAAWPSVTRMLEPDEEAQTSELYSVVDSALDELPARLADAMYLVDIEGHSLTTTSSLLGRDTTSLQRDLTQARNHVRGRVNAYVTSH